MKTCKKCNGTGEIIVPVEEHLGRVMYGNEQCDECNGTGEVRTNFDRITASSEALAEFMNDCADCNNCPVTEKSVCKYKYENCKEAWFEWLNEECKE